MGAMDGTLEEIEGYVSYLEDAPRERLKPAEMRLARVTERLRKLRESLKNGTQGG